MRSVHFERGEVEAGRESNAAIRTPDQRLRVFVSSTLTELAEERAAVHRAISALRLTPVLFELGAQSHPPRELYRAYLTQSDIFIGLYWQRYGWIGPGMDISGLEDEFRLSGSMPRLLYLKAPAPGREARLAEMLREIETKGTVSYRSFRTARELTRFVRTDLAVLLSERFSSGIAPAVPAATAPRKSGQRFPASLPVASTSLIGREHDVAEITHLLDTPGVRLVTLVGPGGIGKTRLAMAVGTRMERRYPQGVAFVSLESIPRPELVMPHVASAVGATIEGTREPLDVVAEHLAESPTLLVLDNLEQVIGVAPEIEHLLARCPRLKILATSRTVLRLRAEREYPVRPLTVPTLQRPLPLDELAALPAVRLFVDRARAVRYDFRLNADNDSAVAEICRRLDGLPLAIEIAAARARILEPRAVLARLASSLDGLGQGPADLPERQRTLRATVDWSVSLLEEAERRTFFALSVFVEGWSLEAALAVTGLPEDRTLDLLDALTGHSLITVDPKEARPRFRMLAPIRELAMEHLAASGERADIERRHAKYFVALVESSDIPAEQQAEWCAGLLAEEGNLGVAIRWFLEHDPGPLPHLFRILWFFWQMGDGLAEGRKWIEELRARANALTSRDRAELSLIWAVTAVEVGDDDGALAAIAGLDGVDASALESDAQLALAWVRPIHDDIDGALRAALSAVDGFRRQKEPLLGWALFTAGLLELALGRHDAARLHLAETCDLAERLGNQWLRSSARTQLASLAAVTSQFDQARVLLRESVEAREHVAISTQNVTFALLARAQLALAEGDPRGAALALGAANGLQQRVGLRSWPSMRRGEAELLARLRTTLDPETLEQARATGAGLDRDAAIALVRNTSLGGPTFTAS